MISIYNGREIVPETPDIIATCQPNTHQNLTRNAWTYKAYVTPGVPVTLPFVPTTADWLEVYTSENKRVVNIPFLNDSPEYVVSGNKVTFRTTTGECTFVCDKDCGPNFSVGLIIAIQNIQGLVPDAQGSYKIATECLPYILSQPLFGWATLTPDRLNIWYIPSPGYIGSDTFSYGAYTQRGQFSVIKCAQISVVNPTQVQP
jgi:hypothetical protein